MSAATLERQVEDPELERLREWPFRFEIVDLSAMWLPPYQRPPTTLVKHIVADYQPLEIGTLLLSLRGRGKKTHALMDGKTRREAMMELGEVAAPGLVLEGLTEQQEAKIFSRQKYRRGITPFQQFQADLVAGEEKAKKIETICHSEGFVISDQISGKWDDIRAVRVLESVYSEDPERLRLMLKLVKGAWKRVPQSTSEAMLRGMWGFIRQVDDIDVERFIERVGATTPSEVDKRATGLREGRGMHGTQPRFVAEVLEHIYRKGR